MNYVLIGGGSGIGLKLAEILTESGNTVHVFSRNSTNLKSMEGVTHHTFDVEKDELPDMDEAIDGFVYLPGTINLKPFRGLKTEDFQRDLDINFLGAVKSLQWAFPRLKKSKDASVVLFSTVAVTLGMPFHASIAAAKGAVEGLTRSLAAEWAPSIRVNAIAPSLTDTPLAAKLLANDDKRRASEERHPLKSVGKPEDLAQMAAFLLSKEKSSWISGQILKVDGGISALKLL
ncbi:MAG: SDR family oxidoreductase [Chitinophagaceae bacterium]|nr:MAG: SDR family oxidoreductase [Chitinophagaceae bacterium]